MTDAITALSPPRAAGYPAILGAAWPRRIARPLRRFAAVLTPRRRADTEEDPVRRTGASALEREIVTIDSFARYLAVNPDMPLEHRERFLKQIRQSCEEIRRELR